MSSYYITSRVAHETHTHATLDHIQGRGGWDTPNSQRKSAQPNQVHAATDARRAPIQIAHGHLFKFKVSEVSPRAGTMITLRWNSFAVPRFHNPFLLFEYRAYCCSSNCLRILHIKPSNTDKQS